VTRLAESDADVGGLDGAALFAVPRS